MKRSDIIVAAAVVGVLAFMGLVPGALDIFASLSRRYGYGMSFVKFAILATFGECLALRLTTGRYSKPGFGLLPKMIVWGGLGMCINAAFTIFTAGTPHVLASFGLLPSVDGLSSGSLGTKAATAFTISCFTNIIFAPWMMTLHKITDTHIHDTGGTLAGALSPVDMAGILQRMDWGVMWGFVFKKTIPFFWIPAHTITFMLPAEFRILFAALLGIALGLILAFAGSKTPVRARA
ncbi:hypothetical protein [Desulfovibrio sp. Fe33]|uniref:hypothetical protein n=1 Tax=Desulfovibrio sp. Fe33 TaxID=3020842 RepID=UPI00234D20C4|nr:hypothetical protein [Desulfovibrio sp. Fe33]